MLTVSALLLLALQQPAEPARVAKIVISPARRTVVAGDTLRLEARALDAAGQPVPNVRILFSATGGIFEGGVESNGLVKASSPGAIPVAAVAIVPGGKPITERIVVEIVPGPAARVAIEPSVRRLLVGQQLQLRAVAYSARGDERRDPIAWTSSAPGIVRVTGDGLVTGMRAGRATITAAAGSAREALPVEVVGGTVASVAISPARVEARAGDVVRFTATVKDQAGRTIQGVTPTWSFSPGSGMIDADGSFVGYERGEYLVSASFGTRVAQAAVRLSRRDVERKAAAVGRLPRTAFYTGEVWIHPNGRIAYLTTALGGDRWYAIDISNPAQPVVTDSVITNARTINDIMTTADGKHLVFTREGAADRKNGIVIASLEDPAHPKVIADFTDGVTSGVHSAFVYTQPKYGTHVYLTNDGTGALNIVDISTPSAPKMVAEWRSPWSDAGRTLHDVDVQDGIAYLAYWNDGLVILDVGNGMKGGTPSNPQLISRFKYDLDALYREAELTHGKGYIRGTHTAWRHRNYVFLGDEVFPNPSGPMGFDLGTLRAYGRLHVVDVSDIEKPKLVAWYEPELGGVHNVWVAGDTLYVGAYNAGFHAFDVSGELRGDLRAQGREIADLDTSSPNGKIPNRPMVWGVVVNPKDGLAYVNDMNNGLWVVRIEPRAVVP